MADERAAQVEQAIGEREKVRELRPNPHAKRHLATLARMVVRAKGLLATGRSADPKALRQELRAVTWALEELGYPPSRYTELEISGTKEVAR